MVNHMSRTKGKVYFTVDTQGPNPALTASQKVWHIGELVKLQMIDYSDRTGTGISILT